MTYTLKIVADPEGAQDPREWEPIGKMICFHRRLNIGDSHKYSFDDFSSWEELQKKLTRDFRNSIIKPIYLYNHSGLSVSHTPFNCRFDSGQVGWHIIDRDNIHENNTLKGKNRVELFKNLDREIEVYNSYLCSDAHGYVIEDEDGEEVEACWGYYSYDEANSDGEMVLRTLKANYNGK